VYCPDLQRVHWEQFKELLGENVSEAQFTHAKDVVLRYVPPLHGDIEFGGHVYPS
jgi:hypothetical protein